ncbi:MAG: hypothetical protein H7144_18120 [Burkholderiales bacterium]|nr:hypothetical protein [Phycisphaerae bacterium]
MDEEAKEHREPGPFASASEFYLARLESLISAYSTVLKAISEKHLDARTQMARLLRKHRKAFDGELDFEVYERLTRKRRSIGHFMTALMMYQESNIVMLASQFDVFLAMLLRAAFIAKPELVDSSERNISLSQLQSFPSIADARRHVIDREIEAVLRGSRTDQFKWLESRTGLKLQLEKKLWGNFIEVNERRNLFVHTDGYVSPQYIQVCEAAGYVFSKGPPTVGAYLDAGPKYLGHAVSVFYEMGVKLAQFLWRKLIPDKLDEADGSLVEIIYECLVHARYGLVIRLTEFGLGLPKFGDASTRLYLTVNQALAKKLSGDSEGCAVVCRNVEWEILDARWQLAHAVLRNDVEGAVRIMHRIGPNGDMQKGYYRHWPLFKEMRSMSAFAEAFKAVFGEPLVDIAEVARGN